jgi:CRP-like cAMP-binding protein
LVAAYGDRRPVRRGEILFNGGDRDYDFHVISQGMVAEQEGGEIVRVHGQGRFLGELGQLTGQPAFFTAVVPWGVGIVRRLRGVGLRAQVRAVTSRAKAAMMTATRT